MVKNTLNVFSASIFLLTVYIFDWKRFTRYIPLYYHGESVAVNQKQKTGRLAVRQSDKSVRDAPFYALNSKIQEFLTYSINLLENFVYNSLFGCQYLFITFFSLPFNNGAYAQLMLVSSINMASKKSRKGIEANEKEYQVETILAKRERGGSVEYFLKWKDCPESENSW